MAYVTAWMETKTIEGFPYWEFEDRDAALRVGPVVFLQSTFPDWAPCVFTAMPWIFIPACCFALPRQLVRLRLVFRRQLSHVLAHRREGERSVVADGVFA